VAAVKPEELAVYDNYSVWFAHLLDVCSAVKALPLDGMLSANCRITLTGALIGPDKSEPADPVAMDRQRRLIESAIRFRDELVAMEKT
jgi:hypothetical protein